MKLRGLGNQSEMIPNRTLTKMASRKLVWEKGSGAGDLQCHARSWAAGKTSLTGLGFVPRGVGLRNRRRCAADTPSLALTEHMGARLLDLLRCRLDLHTLVAKLADGKITECPFSDELAAEGRELVFSMLESAGAVLPARQRPKGQPFFLAALEEMLRISGDPDYRAFYSSSVSFAKGVRLGHASRLPRVPAVFEKKTKWRKYAEDAEGQILRENYISAK